MKDKPISGPSKTKLAMNCIPSHEIYSSNKFSRMKYLILFQHIRGMNVQMNERKNKFDERMHVAAILAEDKLIHNVQYCSDRTFDVDRLWSDRQTEVKLVSEVTHGSQPVTTTSV